MSTALQFDALYKKVSERYKVLETLLASLNERVDAEDRYSRQIERISSQMVQNGGDLDDLLQGAKIDLSQRATYNKQFAQSLKADLDSGSNQLKMYQQQIKQAFQDALKLDKECRTFYEKYEKQREKYLKISKDYEDLAVAFEASMWNKESNQEQRTRLQQRMQQQFTLKNESEQQLKSQSMLYNAQVTTFNNQVNSINLQFIAIFDSLFGLAKDIMMKVLVYEISRQRNLQYDGEAFFKEVEKYQDPMTTPATVAVGQQLLLAQSKENMPTQILNSYSSFMKDVSERIAISYKLRQPFKTDEDVEILDFVSLKTLTVALIARNHNRPIQQDIQNVTVQQFLETSSMKDYLAFIRLSVQQSLEVDLDDWKDEVPEIDISQLQDLFLKKNYRELGIIAIESYRTAGNVCYKKMIYFITRLIDGCQKESDLSVMKRLIIMISTLYKMSDNGDQHIYLQEGLLVLSIWKQIDLWEGLIYVTIEEEIDKSGVLTNREQIFKDKTQIFSSLLSISLNMINFKLEKNDIKVTITKFGKIFSLYELQIQELMKFIENDGKVDVSQNINSISVLSTLYHSQPTEQFKSQIGQQQSFVPKKVLTFDKRPQSTFIQNPLNQPQKSMNTQHKKSEEIIKYEEQKSQSEIISPELKVENVVVVKKEEFQIEQPKVQQLQPAPPQQKKTSFSEHPLEKPQKKQQFEQLSVENPAEEQQKKSSFLKKLF